MFLYLLIGGIIPQSSLFAQSEQENLEKYKHYRQRFNQYFMFAGDNTGESLVVCTRNRDMTSKLCFGQHGVHFGYYLGVLATEYQLFIRDKQKQAASSTLEELRYALLAYKEQLDKCEYYWDKEPCLDGFFIRENIPLDYLDTNTVSGKNHYAHLNNELSTVNVYSSDSGKMSGLSNGQPAYVNGLYDVHQKKDPMSQDEAYGIMMGISLVVKCVPPLEDEAKHLFELIALHLVGKNDCQNCHSNGYEIKKPDCNSVSESTGGVTAFFGYGIAAAASKVTTKDIEYFYNSFDAEKYSYMRQTYLQTGKLKFTIGKNNMYMLWKICGNGIPGSQEWNRSMASTLAAIGDSWGKRTDKSLIKNCYWTKGSKPHDWRTFYLSLWRFLHDKQPDSKEKQLIRQELDAAPYEGPYNFKTNTQPNNFASGGWAYVYRYRATISEQFEGSWYKGVFNGLDYMLMYNLYQLLYSETDTSIPSYTAE